MHPIEKALSLKMLKALKEILSYWENFALDETYGGFLGERDFYNLAVPKANKGIILNSRILWFFSSTGNHFQTQKYRELADRAFAYLFQNFRDKQFGGVLWELDFIGKPIHTRKQIYAQAFMIYALSEYYIYSKEKVALNWALELYELIEKYARDPQNGGYTEAFNREWKALEDIRLSEKDENEAKTMNTHLHILEAYSNLYRVCPNAALKSNLEDLITLFLSRFYNKNTRHFNLFFDEKWNQKGRLISFGHDIETVWLLLEAAKTINKEELILECEKLTLEVADVFIKEGIDKDGGVFYEYHPDKKLMDSDKHWWPQVEAILGLHAAFQICFDSFYLDKA